MTSPTSAARAGHPALRLSIYYGAFFAAIGVYVLFWPLWLASRGANADEIGILLAMPLWVKVFSNPAIASMVDRRQNVCTACGYNMIAQMPDQCPFCGGGSDNFLTDRACATTHQVTAFPVSPSVTRFNSVPRLGIEHAAFRVDTGAATVMIDCPSAFNRDLPRADVIAFTHKDFLGAANQYRELFGAEVWIHENDAQHPLARPFPFDRRFTGDIDERGISGKFIGGHSAGFTFF